MKTSNFLSVKARGFTLIEIMIVIAIIGTILAIALPNFFKTRVAARKNVCIENLSQNESAKQLWGLEHGKKDGDVPVDADLFGPALYMKKKPSCPGNGLYDLGTIGLVPFCNQEGHTLAPF